MKQLFVTPMDGPSIIIGPCTAGANAQALHVLQCGRLNRHLDGSKGPSFSSQSPTLPDGSGTPMRAVRIYSVLPFRGHACLAVLSVIGTGTGYEASKSQCVPLKGR